MAARGVPPPPEGFVVEADSELTVLRNPVATDGDTVRDGDVRLRLNGIDAPELDQRGYRRDGSSVPIGVNSRDYMSEQLYSPENLRFAANAPPSYGRPVGRLFNDGRDVGRDSLRAGQSFAAPEYIADPEQRFNYMEAQRIARQNRLGVHGVETQTPPEFRADPDYELKRQTVGMSAHDPTPKQGMTAEQEQRMSYLYTYGSTSDILKYQDEIGWRADPEHVRKVVAYRDMLKRDGKDWQSYAAGGWVYGPEQPKPLIDPEDGQGMTAARQYTNEFMFGALDEVGAVPDMLGLTPGRETVWNSDRRWADIYANNLDQNQSILAHDRYKYPVTSAVAGTAGALTSGFAIPWGAGVRTARGLAGVGAAYGGVAGTLGTDGPVSRRLIGGLQGATAGAIINPAMGKGLQVASPVAQRLLSNLRNPRAPEEAAPTLPGLPGGARYDQAIDPDILAQMREAKPIGPQTPRSELLGSTSNLQPSDLLPKPSNFVDDPAAIDAGRFAPVRPVNERVALDRRPVVNWRGEQVPKVGPLDMVGFLRANGGLVDQGGELATMGITSNAARRGMDHVGQEARFGPMLADDGMTLDDAAELAWEAGYFGPPDQVPRPSTNEFLDALRDTYDGGAGRRFLPEDEAQLQAFDDMRLERYDLEQQLQDGPVYQDLSGAADEAQPFPPVEAYEDWAGDAVTRIGNIDVSKLDTPQDISRALKQSYQAMDGFDDATRGRISQAETEALAADLDMTVGQLLSRRKGQAFNAEEALAARQMLAKSGNELVNAARAIQRLDEPGDELLAAFREKLVRHVAIQEQVAGMTAEAGRALAQFRQGASSHAVKGDVLSAFVRGGGGTDDLKDVAGVLLDAVETTPGKFNALAKQASDPKWRDKVGELYINALLSNPPTHVVNMVSNTLTSIGQIPEYALASGIGAARRAVMGDAAQERILGSEVGARTFGLLQGTKEGLALFNKALRTGEADDFVSKVEGDQYRAISGVKGEIVRIPTRFLTAEDQLFKGIARRMELNAQAVRIANREGLKGEARRNRVAELVANPTDDMMKRALDYGLYLTYQRQLGAVGRAVSQMTSNSLAAKVVVPFVRTPINLLKFSMERSPAAPLLKEWRADFAAGGERRDLAIAKVALGTGIGTMFYTMAQEGQITGGYPPDSAKGRLMMADGWQPYSIKIGDRYISYSRLDPLSTTMGVAADMATLPENLSARQRESQSLMLVASIMNNLSNKTWLSGVSSLTAGLSDPQRNAENWLERTVSSFAVPAGVAGVARQIDPVAREREGVWEAIKARIPGMSDSLLPRRDVFGEVVETDSLGPDFVSPFWQSKSKSDPVVAEMLRIEKSLGPPGKQFTDDGEKVDYPRDVYDRYEEISGRLTYNKLLGLIGTPAYMKMSDAQRRKAAGKAIRDARADARSVLDDPAYKLPYKGASDMSASVTPRDDPPPPPDGFEIEDSEAEDPLARLRSSIPGVNITSGFRDEAYQQDMRRRGYKPARNSAHLSGDSIDATPPPGMSMTELGVRVRKSFPGARILNEGDHLHITFPGWGLAPAIGNAERAGVVNPALVPPPPAGFEVE